MNIGVFGTGIVGRTIANKLAELGHAVTIGTRDPASTLARTEPDRMGNAPFKDWLQEHPQVRLGTFEEAGAFGEMLFNCTSGSATLDALRQAGEANLSGKILIDIANPLGMSQGVPVLTVSNTDSLAEQVQRAFPEAKVVKSLNTVTARLMVEPSLLSDDHVIYVSGNDADAKAQVARILREGFGWQTVIDLGDITTARAAEMVLPLWLLLFRLQGTALFNFKIVR